MSEETVQIDGEQENPLTVKKTDKQQDTKVVVLDTDGEQENTLTVDYKKEYTDLLLTNALKESKALQALDLPQEIAMDYFKKYFTVTEDKGKISIVSTFNEAKLVDKEGKPVEVNEAIKHIIANNKELSKQVAKKAPSYKGALGIANVDIKNMSVADKVAYRKQIGPTAFRAILSKQ